MNQEKSVRKRVVKASYGFLAGGGEVGDLIGQYDWGRTSLGKIENWPQSLKTSVNILLQSTVPIVMLWGKDGIMIYNDAYSVFAGDRHPGLLGSKVLEGWSEVAEFNANVMKVVLKGKTLSYTDQKFILYRHNVAENVWMNLNYSPIMDETEKPAGVFAIAVETTQRVLAEQRLTTIRAQLDSALAIGSISTWIWDLRNDIVIGDKHLAENFGVSAKEASEGLPLSVFIESIHKDDRDRVSRSISKAISTGSEYEIEYRTVTTKKKTLWVIARGQVQKDDNGTPVFFLGIIIDITDRKEAEKELRQSKLMFDALFGSRVAAIVMADMQGNILDANTTFLRLFGYKKSEMKKGLTSAQLAAKGQDKATQAFYDSIRMNGEAEPVERIYARKDNSEFPAIVGGAMLPGSDDIFIAFILDVSENERLKEINKAKDEFIALASHQLRTPASTVKQYLGVLMQGFAGQVNDAQLEYLKTANKANNRQLAIINDLLKTAQIDNKGYDVTLLPKNLVNIINEVASQYESSLQTRDQKLRFTTSKNTVIVPIDETEISICIANLVENASKYSPYGTTITIDLITHQTYVEFIITDNGVGIEKIDFDKIFDKFTRIDNRLSDTVSGNGLGLYWVKRIIKAHNGSIDIKSSLGKGTCFIIKLPI